MCKGCWEGYGFSTIDNPLVREMREAIKAVYLCHAAGGPLHIFLDDWNIEDESFAFCERQIAEEPPGKKRECYQQCLDLLKRATVGERASALALYYGFWGLPTPKSDGPPQPQYEDQPSNDLTDFLLRLHDFHALSRVGGKQNETELSGEAIGWITGLANRVHALEKELKTAVEVRECLVGVLGWIGRYSPDFTVFNEWRAMEARARTALRVDQGEIG